MKLDSSGSITKTTYDLAVGLYQGTNGTMLGRCDRSQLAWPPGPWGNEPDVITWNYAGETFIVLYRIRDGRWCITLNRPKHSPWTKTGPNEFELATMAGIDRRRILGAVVVDFETLGLAEHFEAHGLAEVGWCSPIVIKPIDSDAPATLDTAMTSTPYVDANTAVHEAGSMLKAIYLDPRLHDGTDLAWAFDKAIDLGGFIPKPKRLNVQQIVAHETNMVGRKTMTIMKTWSGSFLLHAFEADGENMLVTFEDLQQLLDETESTATADMQPLRVQCQQWLFERGLGKVGAVEEIDRIMNSEVDALTRELD